jgi:phosphatidylglycerophosphatase A
MVKFLLSGFGSGWLPIAPGTWGSAVAILMAWPIAWVAAPWQTPLLSLMILVFLWIGVRGSAQVEQEWGKDPRQTVIDEFVGSWITLLGGPLTPLHLIFGFVLFRAFDIGKPLGIRRLEPLGNGWGVMLDDVLAGVYANLVLQVLFAAGIWDNLELFVR